MSSVEEWIRVSTVVRYVPGAVIAVVLAGCSSSPSLQEVILPDLGEPGWEVIVDTGLDAEVVDFFAAIGDPEDMTNIDNVEGFWLRAWESETGVVSIMAGNPGLPVHESALLEAIPRAGMRTTTDFGSDGVVFQREASDEFGPGYDVFVAKGAHFVFISFLDDYSDALVANTVERQLEAIPEYDAEDQGRGALIALTSVAFVLALGFAIMSSKKNRRIDDPTEPRT